MVGPVNIGRIANVTEILTISILKMETIRFSEAAEMQLTVTRCHIPENSFVQFHKNRFLKEFQTFSCKRYVELNLINPLKTNSA
jgi:hypothetical protein